MPRRGWEIPEREATPESVFLDRRKFLKAAGVVSLGAIGLPGCGHERMFESLGGGGVPGGPGAGAVTPEVPPSPGLDANRILYPAERNASFSELDRPLTDEGVAGGYNNFYEFSRGKRDVAEKAKAFKTEPWTVTVSGEVENPKVYDLDPLIRSMPLEERLYRHRCVEAWSMAVPWTGFPMKLFIDAVAPLSSATFVKMTTFLDPGSAPGQFSTPQWPWPYVEGLTMEEATNELTMLVTGIYGHELPKQHGAPMRLVIPWKYGFKSIKSIVQIEFTRERPETFWNTLVPREYGFTANVNPDVPHPRWSQATERMIGSDERVATLPYNGYGEYVADLYDSSGG